MISSLRGTVLSTGSDSLVVEVGGVGFAVAVPGDVAHTARTGEELLLHTALIVREDALSLYGFTDAEELRVFSLLLSVTGVGPKSALGVISGLSVDQISAAVAADDDAPFRRVSGIGPKTAKLIVVQLSGKLLAPVSTSSDTALDEQIRQQLIDALTGLGWPEKVVTDAAAATAEGATERERQSVALLLRRALSSLGPAKGVSA